MKWTIVLFQKILLIFDSGQPDDGVKKKLTTATVYVLYTITILYTVYTVFTVCLFMRRKSNLGFDPVLNLTAPLPWWLSVGGSDFLAGRYQLSCVTLQRANARTPNIQIFFLLWLFPNVQD